jgi:hypothetical protein
MSIRNSLLNTPILTSDWQVLNAKLEEPGNNDYLQVGQTKYRVPLPWLLCFRPDDLQPVTVLLKDYYDYGEGHEDNPGPADKAVLKLPCAPVAKAQKQLASSLALYEQIAGDPAIGRMYWENALESFKTFPLPYLTLDVTESLFAGDEPDGFTRDLPAALAGDASAIPALRSYATFTPGVPPFAPDLHWSTGGVDSHHTRWQNSVALLMCDFDGWCMSEGRSYGQYPRRDVPIVSPAAPNLLSMRQEIIALAQARAKSATAYFSFSSIGENCGGTVKGLISADTDHECQSLLNHKPFREIVGGPIRASLEAQYRKYGFEWSGFVVRSDESVKKTMKNENDYERYEDWIRMPPAKGL